MKNYSILGGQHKPDFPGHDTPDWGGQDTPDFGGQDHRILQLTRKNANYLLLIAVLCVISIFVILPSCKKDKPDPNSDSGGTSNCDDIQNVKKYFAFKVGSWWVYEEENSKAVDTIYVTSYANDPSNYNFDVRMYSTYQDYYYHNWPVCASGSQNCHESGNICSKCVRIRRSKYKAGDFIHEQSCFFYIANVGDYSNTTNSAYSNNRIIVEEIYDNYILSDSLFGKTYKIHELNTFMEGKQPTNHYFTEGVGLIRKELLDSAKTWNLIKYNVVL